MTKGEIRVYPHCCTSAFCGSIKCEGCKNEATLKEFKAWRERTKAVQTDPTWCPSVYEATK